MTRMGVLEEQLSKHWPGIGSLAFHRRVANTIYYATFESRPVVIRLSAQRPIQAVQAELEWQQFLSEGGVPTPRVFGTSAGQLAEDITVPAECLGSDGGAVEPIADDAKVVAAVFERIEGEPLSESNPPTEAISRVWGSTLGRMHALTQLYNASSARDRPSWEQDAGLAIARRSFGKRDEPSDAFVEEELHAFLRWMSDLPQSRDNYGLLHCDHHAGNFRVRGNEIVSFDFDDATHHWFAYDLVIPFNNLEALFPEAQQLRARHWEMFLEGYARENTLKKIISIDSLRFVNTAQL